MYPCLTPRSQLGKLMDKTVKAMVKEIVTAQKSIFANSFKPMLRKHVLKLLAAGNPSLTPKLLGLCASGITFVIMGAGGRLQSEKNPADAPTTVEEEEEEEQMDGKNVWNLQDFRAYLNRGLNKHDATLEHRRQIMSFVHHVTPGDFTETLRDIFLPPCLNLLVDSWRTKVSDHDYRDAWPVLELFHLVNDEEFSQLYSAQHSTSGRFVGVSNTILAFAFCKHVKANGLVPAILASLPDELKTGKQKDRASYDGKAWIKFPDILWNTVFPGIRRFVQRPWNLGKRHFLHFAQIDSARLLCLFAKLNRPNAEVGGFNPRSWRSTIDYPGGQQVSHMHLSPSAQSRRPRREAEECFISRRASSSTTSCSCDCSSRREW